MFAVYRGNARSGFSGLVPAAKDGRYDRLVYALGAVHVLITHDTQRGLYGVKGSKLEKLMSATGSTGRAAGDANVLWIENGIEPLCFDGKAWNQVARVWHDKTKA